MNEAADISLKEYFLRLFDDHEKRFAAWVADHDAIHALHNDEKDRALAQVDVGNRERLHAHEQIDILRHQASETAVSKAEAAQAERNKANNEFRQTLVDQANTFIPQKEADQRFQSLENKIEDRSKRLDQLEGRTAGFSGLGNIVMQVITILVAIAAVAISFHTTATPTPLVLPPPALRSH